ncbi:MAG TPA: hypothetical protein VMV84_03230, partial [Dehalococcoidales bacterium]|nr:hypothetical protein [Dehalococcoidales bacterium]
KIKIHLATMPIIFNIILNKFIPRFYTVKAEKHSILSTYPLYPPLLNRRGGRGFLRGVCPS